MIQAVKIKILPDYKLLIDFNTGESKIYDFCDDLKHPVFSKLKNKKFFANAKIESGGIVWDDETDIATEHLYERGVVFPVISHSKSNPCSETKFGKSEF